MNPNQRELRLERVLDAPRHLVWKALTDPELMKKWWGPEHFTSPILTIDLRVGGKFHGCMRGPDGKDYWSGGVYQEVVPEEKIVVSDFFSDENGNVVDPVGYGADPLFPKENIVTITFEEIENRTRLTILYIVESDEVFQVMLQMQMREGWESSLDKLGRVLTEISDRP